MFSYTFPPWYNFQIPLNLLPTGSPLQLNFSRSSSSSTMSRRLFTALLDSFSYGQTAGWHEDHLCSTQIAWGVLGPTPIQINLFRVLYIPSPASTQFKDQWKMFLTYEQVNWPTISPFSPSIWNLRTMNIWVVSYKYLKPVGEAGWAGDHWKHHLPSTDKEISDLPDVKRL